MPYINPDRRTEARFKPLTAGELNFAITTLVHEFLDRLDIVPRYENINTAIGALECAKLELYRRIAAPYEDKKALQNGDVLPRLSQP